MDHSKESGGIGIAPETPGSPGPGRWSAAFLGLLCLGAGQFYSGFPKRAVASVVLASIATLASGYLLTYAPNFAGFDYLALAFPLLLQLAVSWDAYRCARKPRARKSRSLSVLAFVLLAWFLPGLLTPDRLGAYYFPLRSYYIPSGNMKPTLNTGDYILVRVVPFVPKRGDIVVFEPPDNYPGAKDQLVDRIVAVGGDEVEVKDGGFWLNGARQEEPYTLEPMSDSFAKFRVPEGQFFMMGDNRNDSFDSRYWRAVPLDHLSGRVTAIYWSKVAGRAGKTL